MHHCAVVSRLAAYICFAVAVHYFNDVERAYLSALTASDAFFFVYARQKIVYKFDGPDRADFHAVVKAYAAVYAFAVSFPQKLDAGAALGTIIAVLFGAVGNACGAEEPGGKVVVENGRVAPDVMSVFDYGIRRVRA